MTVLVLIVILILVVALVLYLIRRHRQLAVQVESEEQVIDRLLTVTDDLEHATLNLKTTVADLRGGYKTGVPGGQERLAPPGRP